MTFDWREPLELGERWFQEVAETNILKVTADIKAPILAINGKDDTTVTPDNAEKIVKAPLTPTASCCWWITATTPTTCSLAISLPSIRRWTPPPLSSRRS